MLSSIQQQTYPNVEIILGRRRLSRTCRILRTENRGCPAARNFGFHQSSWDLLVFLDSNDRFVLAVRPNSLFKRRLSKNAFIDSFGEGLDEREKG
jgi:glycosyltransferase involved in cell wall biosynthesis